MSIIIKKSSLLILGITALVFSRTMFLFFNDPEGPNLLIVVVMAGIIYFLSLAVYTHVFTVKIVQRFVDILPASFSKLIVVTLIQLLLVTVFYFCLR